MLRSLRVKLQPVKPILLPIWLRLASSHLFTRITLARHAVPERPLFCVGLMKTGTHSVAQMIEAKSGHEPETHVLWYLYRRRGTIDRERQIDVLRARAALLDLDVEANWLLIFHLRALVKGFPGARFLLTVREPLSWVNSVINQEVGAQPNKKPYVWAWRELFEGYDHPNEEGALETYGHASLEGYLRCWNTYHERALRVLPPERSLVVRTTNITPRTDDIAAFCGHRVVRTRSCQYVRAKKPHEITDLIDAAYLKHRVERLAGDTWRRICRRIETDARRASPIGMRGHHPGRRWRMCRKPRVGGARLCNED